MGPRCYRCSSAVGIGDGGGINAVGAAVTVLMPIVSIATYLVLRQLIPKCSEKPTSSRHPGAPIICRSLRAHPRFGLRFAGLLLFRSLTIRALVGNRPLIGMAVAVPIALGHNIATLRFTADIDSDSPTLLSGVNDTGSDWRRSLSISQVSPFPVELHYNCWDSDKSIRIS